MALSRRAVPPSGLSQKPVCDGSATGPLCVSRICVALNCPELKGLPGKVGVPPMTLEGERGICALVPKARSSLSP